jgi:hypothetical protein
MATTGLRTKLAKVRKEYPDLVSVWHAFGDARAKRRAVEWLLDQGLIDDATAQHFLTDHPDPELP